MSNACSAVTRSVLHEHALRLADHFVRHQRGLQVDVPRFVEGRHVVWWRRSWHRRARPGSSLSGWVGRPEGVGELRVEVERTADALGADRAGQHGADVCRCRRGPEPRIAGRPPTGRSRRPRRRRAPHRGMALPPACPGAPSSPTTASLVAAMVRTDRPSTTKTPAESHPSMVAASAVDTTWCSVSPSVVPDNTAWVTAAISAARPSSGWPSMSSTRVWSPNFASAEIDGGWCGQPGADRLPSGSGAFDSEGSCRRCPRRIRSEHPCRGGVLGAFRAERSD